MSNLGNFTLQHQRIYFLLLLNSTSNLPWVWTREWVCVCLELRDEERERAHACATQHKGNEMVCVWVSENNNKNNNNIIQCILYHAVFIDGIQLAENILHLRYILSLSGGQTGLAFMPPPTWMPLWQQAPNNNNHHFLISKLTLSSSIVDVPQWSGGDRSTWAQCGAPRSVPWS